MRNSRLIVLVMLLMCLVASPVFAKPITVGMAFQEMDNEYFIVMHEAIREAVNPSTVYCT